MKKLEKGEFAESTPFFIGIKTVISRSSYNHLFSYVQSLSLKNHFDKKLKAYEQISIKIIDIDNAPFITGVALLYVLW